MLDLSNFNELFVFLVLTKVFQLDPHEVKLSRVRPATSAAYVAPAEMTGGCIKPHHLATLEQKTRRRLTLTTHKCVEFFSTPVLL